jgi:hypothetical protein
MDLRILKDLQAKFLDLHIAKDLAGELRQNGSFSLAEKTGATVKLPTARWRERPQRGANGRHCETGDPRAAPTVLFERFGNGRIQRVTRAAPARRRSEALLRRETQGSPLQ